LKPQELGGPGPVPFGLAKGVLDERPLELHHRLVEPVALGFVLSGSRGRLRREVAGLDSLTLVRNACALHDGLQIYEVARPEVPFRTPLEAVGQLVCQHGSRNISASWSLGF
jgi:hypothetical protein